MTDEQYKHSHQSPGGHPVGFKESEDGKQSYLTKTDAEIMHETLHGYLLFGVAITVLGVMIVDNRSGFTIGMILLGCFGLLIAMRRGAKLIDSFVHVEIKEDQS